MGRIGMQEEKSKTGRVMRQLDKPTNCSGYPLGIKKPPLVLRRGLHIIRVMSESTTIDNELPKSTAQLNRTQQHQ